MELTHREDVYVVANKTIDHGISVQHVANNVVVERVATVEENSVDLGEDFLELSKSGFDRDEIDCAHVGLQALKQDSGPNYGARAKAWFELGRWVIQTMINAPLTERGARLYLALRAIWSPPCLIRVGTTKPQTADSHRARSLSLAGSGSFRG